MGYRLWVIGCGLWVIVFLPITYNVNGDSMVETLYLIPVGHVQHSLMEELVRPLEERFNLSCKINGEFQLPPESYDRKRDQYHSSLILRKLKDFPSKTHSVLKLGITEQDLYVPGLNYVFGEANPVDGTAIISLQRLRKGFLWLKASKKVFRRRMITEAVHELGHVYGVKHCSNPKCVMFFSNTITDTDRKSDKFCENCLPFLNKR
jgi:archaemetzincin